MGIETLCMSEAFSLAKRDTKYWLLIAHLYLQGLRNPRQAQIMRTAYFFCRHIDDILDGDRMRKEDPEEYVNSILKSMDHEKGGPEIIGLYRHTKRGITWQKEEDRIEEDFKGVINAMLFDYKRGKENQVCTREELEQYYHRTFDPVMNISLIIAKSQFRAKDIPELTEAMGHIYSLRDLEIDLKRGVINIPSEELRKAQLEEINYSAVRENNSLKEWMNEEIGRNRRKLKIMKDKMKDENPGRRVCSPLITSMEKFCKEYERRLS